MKSLLLPFGLLALGATAPAQSSSCPITPYGRTCGPLLSGRVELDGQNRRVFLELENGFASTAGLLLIGNQPAQIALPGNCFLNTNLVLAQPFTTDGNGKATHFFLVPYAAGLLATTQDASVRSTASGLEVRTSNGLAVGPWQSVQSMTEDFTTTAKRDPERTGAFWGGGALKSGRIGSTGVLGDFAATDGRDLKQKDAQGRDIYEWSTNSMTITADRTLTGKPITVTNGVFEFTRFEVRSNEHVRFVGSNPVQLSAAGLIRVDGAVTLHVPRPPTKETDQRRGIAGGKGGPGGAGGGRGGDAPSLPAGNIHGRAGGDVIVAAGHPRSGQAVATGGGGSFAHPQSGLVKDLVWIIDTGTKIFVPMTAAGGGGGSLFTSGKAGVAAHTIAKRPFWPFVPGELGPPSQPGRVFPVFPFVSNIASTTLFQIGGAGGGGAGMHPLYTTHERDVKWSPGAGGAGGGGVLVLSAGGDIVVPSGAVLSVRGGDSNDQPHNNTLPPVHAAGGAGSGGSVLAQCGGTPNIAGEVDALGGKGGQLFEKTLLYISSVGGDGGDGYIRVESDPPVSHKRFPNFKPPATSLNVGQLRPIDDDLVTVATSQWYVTGFLPSRFHYYEIRAKIGAQTIVFSDNRLISRIPAIPGAPVAIYLQSGRVDQSGKLLDTPTKWAEGAVAPLNSDPRLGNGLRWLIQLDRRTTAFPIEVVSVRVYFNC